MKYIMLLSLLATLLFSAIDINSATATELASLKGIGMKKQQK